MTSTSTTTDSWTAPYTAKAKYDYGKIQVSSEILKDMYVPQIKENLFKETVFTKFLREETKKAEKEMKAELNHGLFGSTETPKKGLRQIIGEAYDEAMEGKAAEMDTAIAKAMEDRREARATGILSNIDDLWSTDWGIGTTVQWTTTFHTNRDKHYEYAAVLAGDHLWYVTNRYGGLTIEAIKAVIAEQAMDGDVFLEGTEL